MKPVDYSAEAVTRRLRLASELRDVCLSLKKAGQHLRSQEAEGGLVTRPAAAMHSKPKPFDPPHHLR